ncbi:MAG: hypothetical protein LUD72_05300 [Bacteroidales bacterium]|nr:hypothetical protein [Bacteroidales bacterium]
MPSKTTLDKAVAKRKEYLRRKREKEKLREERKIARAERKKIWRQERAKMLKKRKYNRKAYKIKRKAELAERFRNNDEIGWYHIMIVKNRRLIRKVASRRWKSDAYILYNELIEQNQKEVRFPVRLRTLKNNGVKYDTDKPSKYEIILVRNGSDDKITQLRGEDGKFVEVVVTDKDNCVIVDRNEWLMEETFHLYGYHPIRDRKDYTFIYNKLIHECYDVVRVFVLANKLVVQGWNDFDFVVCKNPDEAARLYDMMEDDAKREKKKNILFMGRLANRLKSDFIDEMMKKTGWSRRMCNKSNN